MQQEKTDIKSMNLEELKSYMESIGEKPFRAKQLYQCCLLYTSPSPRDS